MIIQLIDYIFMIINSKTENLNKKIIFLQKCRIHKLLKIIKFKDKKRLIPKFLLFY